MPASRSPDVIDAATAQSGDQLSQALRAALAWRLAAPHMAAKAPPLAAPSVAATLGPIAA